MIEAFQSFFVSPIVIGETAFSFSPLDFLLQCIIPLSIYIGIARLFSYFFSRVERLRFWQAPSRRRILVVVRRSIKMVLFLATLWFIIYFFRSESENLLLEFWKILTQPLLSTDQLQLTILSLLLIIPVLYLANILSKNIHSLLESRVLPHIIESKDIRFTAANTVRYVLMGLFVIVGLSMIGINLSSITLLVGVLGIGIGFGLQSTVENFFAGIVVIATRPIKVGDRIRMGEHLGDVKRIAMLHTVISTIENETLLVPNKLLVNNVVHNTMHDMDESISLFLRFQVHYDSDLKKVFAVLSDILEKNPYDVGDPKHQPKVFLESFDASGITFLLSFRIASVFEKYSARSHVNFAVWQRFKEEGIIIPYPQLDLHIQKDGPTVPPSEE